MAKTSPKNSLRIPPQDIQAEKALLGSIMLRPDIMNDIMDIISTDSFYVEKHRIIFRSMFELFSKNEPIDVLSLSSKLKEKKLFDDVGGGSYLAELLNTVPSASNAKHYAETVQKKAVLRELIDVSGHISNMGYTEDEDLDNLLDNVEKRVFAVTGSPTTHKFVSIRESLTEAWDRLDRLHKNTGELRGVSTGFKDLDHKLAGFQKSDLIILAARPSMGKTSLALDIARHASALGTPVGIFSLEMSAQQIVDRMLAAEARVDSWKLRRGKISVDEEFGRIRDALDKLAKAPIFIDDKSSNTVLKMRAVSRRLKSEHGLGLIIVDYLQLMTPTRNFESMVQQVTEISRSLKGLARELDVPVLALSQLSRAVEARGGRPRLSDLRDSGSIEQDADVVMFIHREDKVNENSNKPNVAEILIEKHRNGPTGKIELYFDDEKTTFLSLEKDSATAEPQEDAF